MRLDRITEENATTSSRDHDMFQEDESKCVLLPNSKRVHNNNTGPNISQGLGFIAAQEIAIAPASS